MRKLILAAALAAFAAPALASDDTMTAVPAEISVGAELGTSVDAIRTKLTELGWEVRKIEMEGGKIEAYVVKDKVMAEIYVDAATGLVTKVGGDD